MNDNPPASSEEVKSDGVSSRTKRAYVIGVVDTTGMKSVIANRKRRWDQPPGEESDVPPKVVVRKVEESTAEPDQHSVVCEGDPDIEDYDAQYNECISTNNVVSDESVVEPVPEKTTVCDNDSSTSCMDAVCADEKTVESQVGSPKEQSVVEIEPENRPDLPAEEPSKGDVSTDLRKPPSTNVIDGVPENPNSEKKTPTNVDKVEGKRVREVAKTVEAIPVAGIISDSLKQIQFCYDEDSNSTEESEVEAKIGGVESNETVLTKKVDVTVDDHHHEETTAVNPSEIQESDEQSERNRRSPTPVLNDELDENALPEVEIARNESPAVLESKTGADEVEAPHSESTVSAELHDNKVNSANSISLVENSGTDIAKMKDESNVADAQSASSVCKPVDDIQPSKNQQLNEQIAVADGATPVLNISNETSKTPEDLESPEPEKIGVVEEKVVQHEVSDVPSESAQPVKEATLLEEALGTVDAEKEMNKMDESWNGKQFADSMECNSELSLLKDNEMFMEESSDKCASVADKLLCKDSGTVGQNNLISMDNSQNCVGFDDSKQPWQLCLDKAASKSPELELRYSDSEDSNKATSEVTMHFASFRTPEYVADAMPESDFEDTKDESEKAIDALISANPNLSDGVMELQETATSMDGNTMEMLDSLVRRSSEDDPSRIGRGEGMLSEDSLINEINQLPDNDDKKTSVDKNSENYSEPVVESSSQEPKETLESNDAVKTVDDEPKESAVNVDVPECGTTTAPAESSNVEHKVDSPGNMANEAGVKQVVAKSEGTSVEDELSQGGEEEHKSDNVSSENILEVIFGSKQENNIRTVRSEESEVDRKITQENKKEEKCIDGSPIIDIQPETSSDFNEGQQSADDSKLQLNNEEIEIDNTEIVMVDPTKPLSGEDTDNDADDGSSEKGESVNEKAKVTTIVPPDVISIENKTVAQSIPSKEQDIQSVPDEEVNVKEPLIEVEKSKSSDTLESKSEVELVIPERMDVDETTQPPVVRLDDPAVSKPKKVAKDATQEASHVREPAVPVLIIKKQALPSKKDGDKSVVETLLTCSPKAVDNLVSDSSTPPRKSISEGHQIETAQDSTAGLNSPRHSPITLRIYKDNLTVRTDLDSPKRNKSPMSSEFKSELSPKLRSPSVPTENLSPQNKQLEFTLKIAKDVNTNYPKATMSPKNVSSPTSVWKSEVQISDSPSVPNKEAEDVTKITPLPTRGRGRGRGRGSTPRRGMGRGRRGASQGRNSSVVDENPKMNVDITGASVSSLGTDIVIKQEVLTEDEKSEGSSIGAPLTTQIHDMFKKIINKEESTPHKSLVSEVPTPGTVEVHTPVVRKRGRPRKSVQTPIAVPEEIVIIKQEPTTPVETTPLGTDGGEDDGSSCTGRPKRTCRGRTKPIVVKKRKPRGGGAAGAGVPRGTSTPLPAIEMEIKEENASTPVAASVPTEAATPESSTLPTVTPSPPVEKPGATNTTTPVRGRGGFKRPTPDRNTLSEKELAELQKIEAKKEKLRLDRIAKYEAKKAKKLAKKLKDEERRKRVAREKAEKAEAAAPQVFEEETRMSAPDSSSRGHTPAPNRILTGDGVMDESQNSISTPGDTNKGNKKGRMEISITDMDCLVKEVRVDELAEYQWQGSELFMIQEQVSLYLGVKSFKRKYPGLKRRPVEAEERTFLEDSGLVPKSMCDLGLTAVGSAEILDIMFQDFPEKYEEFRKHVRDKQAREASFKQKAAIGLQRKDGTKVEPREQALEAVAAWNANLNRERREERRCALDLQTFTVHYPKLDRDNMKKPTPKVGLYPVAVIPGQFCDHYKKYTPNELMYFPVNTVLYGPLRPNERQRDSDDGSGSESSSSSSSSSSSGGSSSESESEGDEPARCKMCSGTKKKNKDSIPEVLLTCVQCKFCYHPTCKEFTPEMIVHLTKYEWQCTACKGCTKCRDPNMKDRIMCCQLCDRGYHLSCIGLKKMPEGRWHCTVCAYCSSCGSRNPGGSDWQHEFKKGEKGIKIYQRTLCTPCFKLWRKGKYCQLCSKCHSMKPEEDPSLIQCNSCDRWLHKDCYGSKYGLTNKLMSTSSIQCDYCVERVTLNSHGINRPLIKV